MSGFLGGFGVVDSNDVGPVESNTPGWQTTERLNVWQAFKLGFRETFRGESDPKGRRLGPKGPKSRREEW